MSFDVSALFTSIPVPTALDVINHLFTEHIEVPEAWGKYNCSFEENTVGLHKNEVMGLLKLVLENCVFSFQGKFFLSKESSINSYMGQLWVHLVHQWWLISTWNTLRN